MATKHQSTDKDRLLPEYSFRGGVRGKHARAYREGHEVAIHQEDGSCQVVHYTLEDGAVMLDPDVREYFPDSDSVNITLRGLINIQVRKRRTNPKAT